MRDRDCELWAQRKLSFQLSRKQRASQAQTTWWWWLFFWGGKGMGISNQFLWQRVFEEMLTCTDVLIPKCYTPETGTFQRHHAWEHGFPAHDSLCCVHIWAVLLFLYFLIHHICSIFQKLIKVNGLRMSLPDLRTAIGVLPLVHLNFISMGFGMEKRYMSLWPEPEASLPPSACSLPRSWYLFVPLVLAYFLLSFPECWWSILIYLIFFSYLLSVDDFSLTPTDFPPTSSQ